MDKSASWRIENGLPEGNQNECRSDPNTAAAAAATVTYYFTIAQG